MTLAEAKIILGIDSYEDAFDAFEEQLFALKQFFVAKPILQTTILHDLMADMYSATEVTIQYTPILVKQELESIGLSIVHKM